MCFLLDELSSFLWVTYVSFQRINGAYLALRFFFKLVEICQFTLLIHLVSSYEAHGLSETLPECKNYFRECM